MVAGVAGDRFGKGGVNGDDGYAIVHLTGAEVFHPVFRRLHGVGFHLAGVVSGNKVLKLAGAGHGAALIDAAYAVGSLSAKENRVAGWSAGGKVGNVDSRSRGAVVLKDRGV